MDRPGTTSACPPLVEVASRKGKRGLLYHFHPGQLKAWESPKRIVAVIAGVRSGKTSFGPIWLHREMQRCGPGDYLAVAPSFKLLHKAAVPEMDAYLGRLLGLGTRVGDEFRISAAGADRLWPDRSRGWNDRPSRIVFGHADDPESLAAMTAKAAWCDEPGQKRFRLASFEEIQRRLSFDRGRMLLTTTVYDLGWLKKKVYDQWQNSGRDHPDIDVISFKSTENPAFPAEEFEKARRDLPGWKFRMFYEGQFERPAGLVYDCFDQARHVTPRRLIPPSWHRFGGLDFGTRNTAAVYLAEEQDERRVATGRFIAYREYHPQKVPPETHAVNLLKGEPRQPTFVGGNVSEKEWRKLFAAAGIGVLEPPVKDVAVGIECVYSMLANGKLVVMDDLEELLDEFDSYAYELDEAGEPTQDIEDAHAYHLLDSLRYLCSWVVKGAMAIPEDSVGELRGVIDAAPAGVFFPAELGPEARGDDEDDEPEWFDDDEFLVGDM